LCLSAKCAGIADEAGMSAIASFLSACPRCNCLSLVEDAYGPVDECVVCGYFAGETFRCNLPHFAPDEGSLLGYEIQMFRYGYFRLLCYGKHSGIEFYSDEISFRDLLLGLRVEHFLAEAVERCAFLRNAQALLARLA